MRQKKYCFAVVAKEDKTLEYEKEVRILESEDHMDTNGAQEVSPPTSPKGKLFLKQRIYFLLWDDFVLLVISSKHSGGG